PQVTGFTYTPTGQIFTQTKPKGNNPSGNTVTYNYYANDRIQHLLEVTSAGTTVAEHTYSYNPNGDLSQTIEKLMNADNTSAYLTHTLVYSYDPMDRLKQVTTDGATTEAYTHDPSGNVTSQTINGTTINYVYDRNRLLQATTGTGTIIADYNYDPLGRLD